MAAGHQIENARALEQAGAARLLPPEEATAERLAALLESLLADRAALQGMARAARGLALPGAASAIGDHVAAVVGDRGAAAFGGPA
jgi:UDP-N-acetylglucosamine--N-acetylmuramyl-(pentapeptide) pyrophosphoryl-undecaprenol N-acetylglucosamine transferase